MKKLKKRDLYLIVAIINIIWFTLAVLWLNHGDHEVSSELIVGWFAAWTAELALLAGLTNGDRKRKASDDVVSEEEDEV